MTGFARAALGVLAVTAVLTGVLLLDAFPHRPSSPAEWALFVLVGVSACVLFSILGEYAIGRLDERVEASRRRRGVNTTGARALVMLVAGLTLIFAFALSLPLFLGS